MSVTLEKDSWKIKDPLTGEYRDSAVFSTTLPEEAAAVVADAQSNIETIAQAVASMAEFGTDKTLTIDGAAADAKEVGDAINTSETKTQTTYITTNTLQTNMILINVRIPAGRKYTLVISDESSIVNGGAAYLYYYNARGNRVGIKSYTLGTEYTAIAPDDIASFVLYKGADGVVPPGNLVATCTYEMRDWEMLNETDLTDELSQKTVKDYLTPQMFGAVGDGVTDDYEAFALCLAEAASKNIPIQIISDHALGTGLNLNGVTIYANSLHTITFGTNINPLVTINTRVSLSKINFKLRTRNYSDTDTIVGILIKGTSNSLNNIRIQNCFKGIVLGYDGIGIQYNHLYECYALNNVEGICLYAYGNGGWCNENIFTDCTVRIDSDVKTILNDLGYSDRYAIVLDKFEGAAGNVNGNKFIGCNVENHFNGFSVRGYYNMFLNCRNDGNDIFYYFHQTNGGYNFVIGAWGSYGTNSNKLYELDDNGTPLFNNYILFRNYPFYSGYLRMASRGSNYRPTYLVAQDTGVCMFDNNLGKPIWWRTDKWVDANGDPV